MKRLLTIAGVLTAFLAAQTAAHSSPLGEWKLAHINRDLRGRLLDFTRNHCGDKRIWSAALGEKRDLYVYVPPCYNPRLRYPFTIFLHGANQDEGFFLKVLPLFDKAISEGKIPPVIIAAPDGSIQGRVSWYNSASFWANTRAGRFEDWVMCDVWDFVMNNFSVRPERGAHALIGASMGGAGAFALAMKHKDRVKIAIGFVPALNLRWVDCHGKYRTPFDPCCWGWREEPHRMEVIGRPALHIPMRYRTLFEPITGHGPDAMAELSRINPAEIMEACDLRPGELDLYIAYGGKDQFNIMAQVESFLFLAKARGIHVDVDYDPNGRHDFETGARMLPAALAWVAPRVAPYGPLPAGLGAVPIVTEFRPAPGR